MKPKKVDIQILEDGEELISSVCQNETMTLTIKCRDNSYRIILIEKNDVGLFKLKTDYEFIVTKCNEMPLIKTKTDSTGKGKEDNSDSVRTYTL